jgi:iron complex transport system substrate-binding protein
MREETETIRIFTSEMLEAMAYIWTRSSILLMDVRYKQIDPKHPLKHYKLPSSMLLYVHGGTANVQLNEANFAMERFGLFHGGKGTVLSILPDDVKLESYMVLYKAGTSPFFKRDLQRLLQKVNPFGQLFGYSPSNPVWLISLFQQMLDGWNRATTLKHFYTHNLFHQTMYEIYKDLERREVKLLQQDPVIATKRYLDENYMHPVMFQEIADMFAISSGQLTRLFKKREGKSLQEYVIQKRLGAARRHLENTNATVKEIAVGCGFTDEVNFFRLFKKHFKMTPIDYRKINTLSMQRNTIDNDYRYFYNEIGLGKLVKSAGDGEFTLFGKIRSKEMILATALSLMLLLSACGANANAPGTNGEASNQTSVQTHSAGQAASTKTVEQTRVIQTVNGEVEVPADPQRVLITSMWMVGDVIPFGKEIVGVDTYFEGYRSGEMWKTAFAEPLENAQFVDTGNLEALMALEPDLIIGRANNGYGAELEQLNKIAPTVQYENRKTGVEGSLRTLGELFGMPEKAEELIDGYHKQVEQAKQALQQADLFDKKIVFIQGVEEGNVYLHGDQNRALFYSTLGMHAPDLSTRNSEVTGQAESLSLELLPEYLADADIIVYRRFEELESLEVKLNQVNTWKKIPAVQAGNIIYPSEHEPFMSYDYTSHMLALQFLIDQLLELPIAKK